MFHIHRAERTDVLADALAERLSVPLDDPMSTEVIVIPAMGVERWLQQHLATSLGTSGGTGAADGVAANIDFVSPAEFTDRLLAAADRGGPWRPAATTWSVLRVLDARIDDDAMSVLARHLGAGRPDDHRRDRRYATARHIAGLFDSYGRQRPSMLAEWAAGADTDGAGAQVDSDLAWQPDFWRAVRADIGVPHPAERLSETCAELRADGSRTDLPQRISVFGPTRVTESFRQVLGALSEHRDVHLYLPHPSPALWDSVDQQICGGVDHDGPARRATVTPPAITHPMLAGQSRDVQELQRRIAPMADHVDHLPARLGARSVLTALQDALRGDRVERAVVTADTSVEVHACHGPERQVEVLADRLLHLFAEDPTLEPRDVLVMCPDVETFAPLIRGTFGQPGLDQPAFGLRVRLADRGPRHTNEILDALATIVELAAGRITAGAIADLMARIPVRNRFELSDDELEMIREWLASSNIRWALDDTQRARFGLAGFGQGTFESGLDRIALGAVADEAEGQWLGTALPLGGVESTLIDLAGRFGEFIDRLSTAVAAVSAPQSPQRWLDELVAIVDALLLPGRDEEWQRAQAIRALTQIFDGHRGTTGDAETVLRLGDVRDLFATLLAGTPTRANFRTGELTVCSMVPMRSVPHRVIVLLGIDSDTFPRTQHVDGDDILTRAPLIGERHPRDEDRQVFLDAVGAAGEHLLVLYSGADPVTGQRIPPAMVVSELIDAVAESTGGGDVVRRHTLHGFDKDNFTPGAIAGIPGPFGHDPAILAGVRALVTEPSEAPRLADLRLDAPPPDDIDLDALIAFLVNPIEGFVRQRLGARLPADDRPHPDQLDLQLQALDAWAIGDRFLSRMLGGADLVACQAAELRRGSLPPFAFGTRELESISADVAALFAAAAPARSGVASTADVVVPLPDGRRIHGTVGDVFNGSTVTITYSKLRAKQRISAWVRLLALAASRGRDAVTAAVVIARRPVRRSGVARSLFAVPEDPAALLADLVAIRDAGLRRVLPLPLDPAVDFVEHVGRSDRIDRALKAAQASFERTFGAHTDPYLRLAFGGDIDAEVAFGELLTETTATMSEWFPGGLPGAPDAPAFAGLSSTLWTPLTEHETRT